MPPLAVGPVAGGEAPAPGGGGPGGGGADADGEGGGGGGGGGVDVEGGVDIDGVDEGSAGGGDGVVVDGVPGPVGGGFCGVGVVMPVGGSVGDAAEPEPPPSPHEDEIIVAARSNGMMALNNMDLFATVNSINNLKFT